MSADVEPGFPAHGAMEALLDKLKLLNYEAEFFRETKMKPIHRQVFLFFFKVLANVCFVDTILW